MPEYLLDTCAVIWKANGDRLREPGASALKERDSGPLLHVSPITAWEIAALESKRKILIARNLDRWFHEFCSLSRVSLEKLSHSVLISSIQLPGNPPTDSIDRILIATAREYGYTLVTRDKRMLAYGKLGYVQVVEC